MARSRVGTVVHGWIVLPLVAATAVLIPIPAWFVEAYYSRGVYPWLQLGITTVSNLVPIAVLDVLIVAAIGVLTFRSVLFVRAVRTRGALDALWEVIRRVLRAVAVLLLIFLSAWGCHYRRTPLEQSLRAVTTPSIMGLQSAIGDANALGASLRPESPPGDAMTYGVAADALQQPMQDALASLNLGRLAKPGRPKFSLILTPFFTWAGVTGMIDPLALESIVHPDLLPFERPFVLAHEWAHLAGEADEAEASAVGWLACMHGGPVLAYSASLFLIEEAGAALPPAARAQSLARLDPGIRADLTQIARRMRLQKPIVQRAAFQVYDEYLKANTVEDGTASYGRALTLILSPQLRDSLNHYTGRGTGASATR